MNFKSTKLRSDIRSALQTLNGLLAVKGGRGWVQWLIKAAVTGRGGITSAVVRSAVYYVRVLVAVYRHQGMPGVIVSTKSWYVLTMQAVAGMKIPSAQALGPAVARTRSGLPRVIPAVIRDRIRRGDRFLLRIWLSWFSIYRVLEMPGKLKLGTITEPGVVFKDSLWREILGAISEFCNYLGYGEIGSAKADLPPVRYIPLSKSTPSLLGNFKKISGSVPGILFGARALFQSDVWHSFCYLADGWISQPKAKDPQGLFAKLEDFTIRELAEGAASCPPVSTCPDPVDRPVGKLGLKKEAAGKVRVFAMVECWTQWLLYPLHSFIFKVLSGLPTDGTMDQLAPIKRLQEGGHTRFWCYDLSAATDRLPVDVQANILNYLFGNSFGWAWKHLLVGRDYVLPSSLPSGVKPQKIPSKVRYAVGQPMGALSSWAMLALTHHLIVAMAARRVGFPIGTFWEYAVLGDDIVIAHGKVAGAYLQLMKDLGVGIGLAKSLVSRNGTLEFAKRFFTEGVDVSPIPFKEIVTCLHDFESSTFFISKYELGARSIAALVGYGYRVRGRLIGSFRALPRKLSTVGIWRCSPWGPFKYNWATWLNITSFVMRREWVVLSHVRWPALPEFAKAPLKDLASKDAYRLEEVKRVLPKNSLYAGSRTMSDWYNDGLYDQVRAWTTKRGIGYKVIAYIQLQQWGDQLPLLREDLQTAGGFVHNVTSAKGRLPENHVNAWVENFRLVSQIGKPRYLGDVVQLRQRPTILAATRLRTKIDKKRGDL